MKWTTWRKWRMDLGPFAVGVSIRGYVYTTGHRRWIIEPFVVFDRDHGGSGTRAARLTDLDKGADDGL